MQELSCALRYPSQDSPKLRPDIAAPIVEDRVYTMQVPRVELQKGCLRSTVGKQMAIELGQEREDGHHLKQ